MLSSVLRSPTAIEVNIRIMRAFVAMRRFLLSNAQLFQCIETLILDDKELYLIGASLKDLGKKCFAIAKLDPVEIAGLKGRL